MPSAGSASGLVRASRAALQKLSRASRTALQSLPRAWRHGIALRNVRETDALWVNDHLRQDVGVVDARPSRAERDTWSRVFDADPRSLLAAALVATAMQAWACDTNAPGQGAPNAANATVVGVFSGEFVNGAPVYRLPPVAVVASRKALAAQESSSLRARQARVKAAAKPPA